jgi:hypothetical protein
MSFLGSRCVSSHGMARMPTKCAPRLQVKRAGDGDDGDSSFEDDGHDDSVSDIEERVGLDVSGNTHKSGGDVAQHRGCGSLSEAAFYLSLGESDGAEVSAAKERKANGRVASANLDIDDNFDEVDGALRPGVLLAQLLRAIRTAVTASQALFSRPCCCRLQGVQPASPIGFL